VAFGISKKHSDFNKITLYERKAPSILKLEGVNTQLPRFYSSYSQCSAYFPSWISRIVKCGGLHDTQLMGHWPAMGNRGLCSGPWRDVNIRN
jgi:hypothetical protein